MQWSEPEKSHNQASLPIILSLYEDLMNTDHHHTDNSIPSSSNEQSKTKRQLGYKPSSLVSRESQCPFWPPLLFCVRCAVCGLDSISRQSGWSWEWRRWDSRGGYTANDWELSLGIWRDGRSKTWNQRISAVVTHRWYAQFLLLACRDGRRLALIGGKELMCGITCGIDATETYFDKVSVCSGFVCHGKQLDIRIAFLDFGVLQPVAVIEEWVDIAHLEGKEKNTWNCQRYNETMAKRMEWWDILNAMPRMISYSPSKLNAEVMGWNYPSRWATISRWQKDATYSSNTNRCSCGIDHVEIAARGIQGMYRVLDTSELEGEIHLLTARDSPYTWVFVVLGTLNAAVDGISQRAGNLRKSVSRIQHDDQSTLWCTWDDGLDFDGLTVWTNNPINISIRLPMLIQICQLVDFVYRKFGHVSDVLKSGNNLWNRELARDDVPWVF